MEIRYDRSVTELHKAILQKQFEYWKAIKSKKVLAEVKQILKQIRKLENQLAIESIARFK